MQHLIARHYSYAAAAPASGVIHQPGHQNLMRGQQVGLPVRLPLRHPLVGLQRIARLLNLTRRRDHQLAVEDRRDLRLTQRVALDSQRALNGADAVDTAQPQVTLDAQSY